MKSGNVILSVAERSRRISRLVRALFTRIRGRSLGLARDDKSVGAALSEPAERALLRHLLQFSDKVSEAAQERRPSTLASYLLETAQLFNTFYHQHKVLEAPKEIRAARLALVAAVAKTLQEGLRLLGIETVEEI